MLAAAYMIIAVLTIIFNTAINSIFVKTLSVLPPVWHILLNKLIKLF